MDLLISANTVAQAQADTAPATGTPGWATDGDPAQGILATDSPAWHYNMMMSELIAFVKAAGMTPSNADWSQTLKAAQILFAPAQRGVAPYNAALATLIGGYPKFAVVVDAAGAFWVSTADANMTVPGADGAKWQNLLSGYLPLSGGTLTGDMTIKGLTSWSMPESYTSYGLILSGQNNNIVTLRQSETTGQYTQLAIQVNGYGGANGYFSLRNDGTFWANGMQLATVPYARGTVGSSGSDWFWMKLPNGWIIQGGNASYYASDGKAGTTITLPTSFGAQFVVAVGNDIGPDANSVTVMRINGSTIRLLGREVTGGTLSNTIINYLCIGTAP